MTEIEEKVDKLIAAVLELAKSQAAIEERIEEVSEKLDNINLSGDGWSVDG